MSRKIETVFSGLTVERRQFTWKIENFDMVRNSEELIKAQKFKFQAGESIDLKTDWKFWLAVHKKKEEDVERSWIGIFLQCKKFPDNVKEVNVTCRFSIKKSGMYQGFNGSFKQNYTDTTPCWGHRRILRKDAKVEELPLTAGSLIVKLEVDLFAPVKTTKSLNGTGSVEAEFERKFVKKLQSDLGKLYDSLEDHSHSQVETMIISKDNVEHHGVNGGLLSARSPVFKAMLGSDMVEANTGVIRIAELSSKTIAILLRFIYTGTLHEDWSKPEVIVQLVYAAEKYQLPDLVEFLDNVLGQVCTKETGGKLLNLAKKLGMKKAEKKIFEKMKREISNSDDLMTLLNQSYESDLF